MTGTKNDRDMTGVLYGGVWENLSWKEHLYNYCRRKEKTETGDCVIFGRIA